MSLKITYFVHGTTTDNEQHRATGWLPGELSELGRMQAKELGEVITTRFDVMISSDLQRAVDSAELGFAGRFLIIHDERLRECNYGDLNGADESTFTKTDYITHPFPGGESYHDVEVRVQSLLDDLCRDYDAKHIAFMAHHAPQLALEVLLNGKTWEQAFAEDWRKTKAWQPGWDYESI
jgi:alpha-ribazole phosphatase/probable phosphoglycerate mutase